jgi:glutamine amidotransferase
MTNFSEEGNVAGLGWINASTKKFKFSSVSDFRIPHVGWNTIKYKLSDNLFKDIEDNKTYYFTHSYYVECNEESNILSTSNYGLDFVSSFKKDNIYGTQFHPEKSHLYGLKLLENFSKL